MKVNTKIRYGLRTIIQLAQADDNSGILQKQIAQTQHISNKYLDSIIPILKAKGLIRNIHGKKSGYILTRPAEEITVFDVYSAFEHKVCILDCLYQTGICDMEPVCIARDFWNDLNSVIDSKMKNTKISDLI
ncbi:MAG: Rrf2 family transcriptional regulator [Bacteroidota bacterium]|jgi:Rrf2 family protein